MVWHVQMIMDSPFPQTGAYEGLLVGIPLLLCVVAAGYHAVGVTQAHSFTQSMN